MFYVEVMGGWGYPRRAWVTSSAERNWIYLDFPGGGRLCFDAATLETISGQSRMCPSVFSGELRRIAELVRGKVEG